MWPDQEFDLIAVDLGLPTPVDLALEAVQRDGLARAWPTIKFRAVVRSSGDFSRNRAKRSRVKKASSVVPTTMRPDLSCPTKLRLASHRLGCSTCVCPPAIRR